jgi:hypothetical protein
LDLARRAVARWAAFPVEAHPRPLVLAQSVITSGQGFTSGGAKDACFDGSFEWFVEVPESVRVRARHSADRLEVGPTKQPLAITHAGRGEHTFLTDRGPLSLPAYWLKGPSLNGSLWVLDPEVEVWEPVDPARMWGPGVTSLMRTPWGVVEAETDGHTITFPWSGSPSADYRVELFETETAISAVAILVPQPNARMGWWAGPAQTARVPARLSKPIGNRVFVDLRGEAMQISTPGLARQSTTG